MGTLVEVEEDVPLEPTVLEAELEFKLDDVPKGLLGGGDGTGNVDEDEDGQLLLLVLVAVVPIVLLDLLMDGGGME